MRPICKSLGRRHMPVISPTGSGRSATSRSPSAMLRMRCESRVRRSTMAGASPSSRAAIRSFSLDSINCSVWSISACAIFCSSSFLTAEERLANIRDAALASCAIFSICSATFILFAPSCVDHHVVAVNDLVAILVAEDPFNLFGLFAEDSYQLC